MSLTSSLPVLLSPLELNPELPLFVFLPGLDGTGQLLQTQTESLKGIFDVRCLAIPPTDQSSWQELAATVVALVRQELALHPRQLVYLCGESFGGCLALQVALLAPELWQRIILINPASSFGRRPWIGWSALIVRWLPEPVYRLSAVTLLPFLASLERILPADQEAMLAAIRTVPQVTSLWRLSLLNQFQLYLEELRRLTMPILLIASAADRLLPSVSEVERLQAALPQAEIMILPSSGHACLLESEVRLAKIIDQFEQQLKERKAVGV
jgi:pimeloyl-ACP methyl ester carboxylesterase